MWNEWWASSTLIERPPRPLAGLRRVGRDLGLLYAANGLIRLIFAATGPVAVILAVGTQGGLTQAELASWLFGVFFLNGVLTVAVCWVYRQPLAFFWTIPGTVLVGPALGHLRPLGGSAPRAPAASTHGTWRASRPAAPGHT